MMFKSCLALFFFLIFSPQGYSFDHSAWDSLLKAHVKNGEVDYERWSSEKGKLDRYLESVDRISLEEFANFSREERIALWINGYNAAVIRLILDHYPLDSIEKIENFWDVKAIRIASIPYSLREVREKVFRQGFRDERATLALVSGTKTSGPLRDEAYVGSKVTEQLRDQMNLFLSDERYNQIRRKQKKLKLSPLFQELAEDFVLGYGPSASDDQFSPKEVAVLGFIRVHVRDPKVKEWIDGRKYKLRYLKPNLALNRVAKTAP